MGPSPVKSDRYLFLIFIVSQLVNFTRGEYYLSSTPCGSLFSEENFGGQNISFLDGEQSINLYDDHRIEIVNWTLTKSVSIENSCSMDICNETYFDGQCHTMTQGEYPDMTFNLTDLGSASCSCAKECKCEDIFMKKTSCARAYLEGGCRICHALYLDLESTVGLPENYLPKLFPEQYTNRVKALKLRKGCTLKLFPDEEDLENNVTVVATEIYQDFNEQIQAFECECDDSQFIPMRKLSRPESYPPLIDVPTSMDEVIKMLMEEKYSNHPGLRAAHRSLKSKRSSRNVYIMLLGSTGSGKSTTINLLFDNPNVTKTGDGKSTTTNIHEFRIPVPIDELGVANSELRVIDTPGLGDTRGVGQDAMFLATLDYYLATHEELKDRIPNVVLIFHKFNDNRFNGKGSAFVQMLRGLDSFRGRITDENYSNVIFVLSHFCSETNKIKRRPEKRLAEFKEVIEDFSQFPRPTIISIAENKPKEYDLPMVNGYAKLPNNEYYPRNLFEKLELVTEKSEDHIGLGIFRTAFRDSTDFNISSSTTGLLPNQNTKVSYYFGILSNALIGVVNTEISQLLKHVWDEKLDVDLKRKFPESLPNLQKTLNLKNINTMDDVPKTATAILELLTTIKHDQATRSLVEDALGIKAPTFPSSTIAGHSYNVFKDTHLASSPFVMGDLKASDIGFMIPKSLSVKIEPGNKEHFHNFPDKEAYIQYRLQSLGIEGVIPANSFSGVFKPGHNIKAISFKNDSCIITATREVRLFEFKLNDKVELTEEFKASVTKLPQFNESDHETVEIWNNFFNEYGTHVANSVFGGGAIEIELKSDKPYDSQLSQALFDLIKFAEEMSFLIIYDGKGNETGRGVISAGIDHSLKFIGGDSTYHTTDLTKMSMENAAKLLTEWKKSLKHQPAMLTTEMKLVPLGQIVKVMGQNYSIEIERATSLLFDSSLKYVPPKRKSDNQPGFARDQTPMMSEFLAQTAKNNAMMQQMMAELTRMEAERQKRNEEFEKKRLEYEREDRQRDRELQERRELTRNELERDKIKYQRELIAYKLKAAKDREDRQARYQMEMAKLQNEISERNNKMMAALAESLGSSKAKESGVRNGCLKPGTKILMADGSEKNVEDLKIGDKVLDMNMIPTKVLGVNYQYVLDLPFYGFDNQSFFFTGDHMFVGKQNGLSLSSNDFQLYVQSITRLLENNPLMKFWDVAEMSEVSGLEMLHYNKSLSSVVLTPVKVFEELQKYPEDTPIYFLRVDSPSGTYFANGYVCKVDIPPVELWPNTMSLLFNLMRDASFVKLSELKFSLETIMMVNVITSNIRESVTTYIDSDFLNMNNFKNTKLMTLETSYVDECFHEIFSHPTSALISISLYSKLGNLLSLELDNFGSFKDQQRIAQMQHELFDVISMQLEDFVKNRSLWDD